MAKKKKKESKTAQKEESEDDVGAQEDIDTTDSEEIIPAWTVPEDDKTESALPAESKTPTDAVEDLLPRAYEIEYRTRVRFPAPEILSAAANISERVNALEEDLAAIKALVAVIQNTIARGFDITESSSAIYASDEAAAGMDLPLAKTTKKTVEEEPEAEALDDEFMTLL